MPTYLSMRIIAGALQFTAVVALYPQFKADIDAYLISKGRGDLIAEDTEE